MVESDRSQMTIQDGAEMVLFASWIPKTTNTHSEYVILIAFFFHGNNGGTNAPQCYANRTLSVLFTLKDVEIKTYSVHKWSRIRRKGMLIKCLGKQFRVSPYAGCPGGNVPDFGRMFLTLKYADITQNTYIRS